MNPCATRNIPLVRTGPTVKTRTFTFVSVALALLFLRASAAASDNPLVGTWQLLSSKGTERDGRQWSWEPQRAGGRSIKIFSATHFAVVTHGPSGLFANASAGPYRLGPGTFTEILEESSSPKNVGTSWVHHFAVSADLLTSSYVNPVSGARGTEVWRRVRQRPAAVR
jgi:hypothetical protein